MYPNKGDYGPQPPPPLLGYATGLGGGGGLVTVAFWQELGVLKPPTLTTLSPLPSCTTADGYM